jgi:dCTP deaminase
MILSAQTIRRLCDSRTFKEPMLSPFHEKTVENGMTYGLSSCGYDIRLKQDLVLYTDGFILGSSMEEFCIPTNIMAVVHDKSSLARRGLSVFNTVIEPGWKGFLTLELKNQGIERIYLPAGSPIAQIIFRYLDEPTELPYEGKYQNQADRPVPAVHEGEY